MIREWRGSSRIEDIHNRLLQKEAALSLQVDVTATPQAQQRRDLRADRRAIIRLWRRFRRTSSSIRCCPMPPSRAKLHEQHSDEVHGEIRRLSRSGRDRMAQGLRGAREAGQEGDPLRDDRRHEELRRRGGVSWKGLSGFEGDAVLVIHTKNNGEISEASSGQEQGRTGQHCEAGQRYRRAGQPVQGDRLRDDAEGRLGRAERDDHRGAAAPMRPRATSCPSRRWGGGCARCIRAASRNM